MTIVEQIRAEIERLMRENSSSSGLEGGILGLTYEDGINTALNDVLEIFDTIQERPVCEGLEEAAKAYADDINSNECLYTYTDFTDAFKAGAKWQKEQMIKEAVEGEIINAGYPTKIELNTFYSKFEHGQEVKLIIVKED